MNPHIPTIRIDRSKYRCQREYLMTLISEGAKIRFGEEIQKEILDRIEHEFIMLNDWNVNYLLFLYEIFRNNDYDNTMVYTARGKSAGSIICYCLGFTHVNPLKYGLLFDLFLSDESQLLQIDFEMGYRTRTHVIKRLQQLFGESSVSLINHHCCAVIVDDEIIERHTSVHFTYQPGIGKILVTDNTYDVLEKKEYQWCRLNLLVTENLSIIESVIDHLCKDKGLSIDWKGFPIDQ